MTSNGFIQLAYAESETVHAGETASETSVSAVNESEGGIEIQYTTIAFQALNFLLLVFVLHKILYKPIIKILAEREKRIREGVENAEKADSMLKESNIIRQDMIKGANAESQEILEHARKSAEDLRAGIVQDAHNEADHIIKAGQNLVEMEKSKAVQDLKKTAAAMIVSATEKICRAKIDAQKDSALIEESLQGFSAK